MTASSSVVSCAGMMRWRPAQATGCGSGSPLSTVAPRSSVEPDMTASFSSSNAACWGSNDALAPRSARRRASAIARPNELCNARDAVRTRRSRNDGQQHSIRHIWAAPLTNTTPSTRQARAAASVSGGRLGGRTAKTSAAIPAAPANNAHTPAVPRSHSAAARLAAQPAITT